ncbi:MAG TPA: ATP-dependent Clp protease proteolytic subunit [Pirellulaceae bacterium]
MSALIRFIKDINDDSVFHLVGSIDQLRRQGCKDLTVGISSGGGDCHSGRLAESVLIQSRMQITTVNLSRVQSDAVPLFCVGSRRVATPHSTFVLHSVGWTIANERLSRHQMRERAEIMDRDQNYIVDRIAAATDRDRKSVEADIERGLVLSPTQAVDYGLAHSVEDVFENNFDHVFNI